MILFKLFFSLFSFLAFLLNPSRSAQTTIPGCHQSVTHATNTLRSATHNPKPPLASHPRQKHLKIGSPTTTPTAQSQPWLHHHVEISANHYTQAEIGNPTTTPTTPPRRRDRRKPPHPGRDQQANPNPSPRRANPHPNWRRDRQPKPTPSKPKPNHHKGEQRGEQRRK